MAWTNFQIVLAILMVVTGSINTLATKWADKLTGKNSAGEDKPFNHPFLQACSMFLGEFICIIVFKIQVCCDKRKKKESETTQISNSCDKRNNKESETTRISNSRWNPVIFLGPAMCDMTATSIMYVGLNLTYASSFQMLRGAVIVFTGLLSVAFLERKLKSYEWLGIFIVIVGLACVGISDIINPSKTVTFSRNSIITGDLLIIMAQIIVATQMVVEEKFLTKYNVPALQGVGWEGLFGFVILSFLLIPMYFIKVGNSVFDNPGGRMENAYDGFVQMYNNPLIIVAITGTIVSIAFFNYAGLSVTKEMSATTRMVLDSVRTFTVWIFSLSVGWQTYHYLQLVGFLILLCGMCLYNDVLLRPLYLQLRDKYGQKSEAEPLLRSSDEEFTSPSIKTKSSSING